MAIDDVEPQPKRFRVWGTINYSYLVREENSYKTDETVEAADEDDALEIVLDMAESKLPLPHNADDLEMDWAYDSQVEELEPPPPPSEAMKMRALGVPELSPSA